MYLWVAPIINLKGLTKHGSGELCMQAFPMTVSLHYHHNLSY